MQAADRSLTSVIDGTLLSWLPNLGPDHSKIVSQLNHLPIDDPVGQAWCAYVTGTRAWIFERKSGDGGFAGGMSVMLCIPRQPAGNAEVPLGHAAWLDTVDAFGVPLLADGVKSPTIHFLNPAKRSPLCAGHAQRPALLMSLPRLLSAWSIYPPNGHCHGWRSLESLPDTQSSNLSAWIAQLSAPRLARLKAALLPFMAHFDQMASSCAGNFFAALSALEELLAQAMVRRFVHHLNPVVARACLTRREALYPEEYNWVVSAKSARAWEMRMDVLAIFPAISVSTVFPCLASVTPTGTCRKRRSRSSSLLANPAPAAGTVTYAEIVDKGLPLVKGLARSFGVRPVAVRALMGVTNRSVELLGHHPLGWEDVLRTLDSIPPERHPKTIEQWRSFSMLYMECVRLYQAMGSLHATLARRFMESTARPWMAENGKDWQRAETRWRYGMHGLVDLSDAIEVANEVRDIVSGLGLIASERYQAFGIFAGLSPTVWRIYVQKLRCTAVAKSTHWHDVWTPRLVDGVLVRALNSEDSLAEEGRVMSHCIHTYRDRLQTQRQIAFAIGERGTPDRSTVLLKYESLTARKWHVTIIEHRARFNGSPSAICHSVAKQLCQELSSERCADALNLADMARVHRYKSAPTRQSPVQGMIRAVRNLPPANILIDCSQVREPLLMLIAGC